MAKPFHPRLMLDGPRSLEPRTNFSISELLQRVVACPVPCDSVIAIISRSQPTTAGGRSLHPRIINRCR